MASTSTNVRAARSSVRWTLCTPANVDEVLPAADRAPRAPETEEAPSYEQPLLELGMLPAPRALPVSRLSYSGLEAYRRCGYRFYLQRALRLAPVATPAGAPAAEPGISALLRGTVVHGLLERLDFARPAVPSEEDVAAAIEQHGIESLPSDVADVRDMVERLAGAELTSRIAAAGRVRTELPFAFTLDVGNRSLLINGVVDVLADEGARTLVVDWKSDALGELGPEELTRDHYATQRIIYALAALRAGAERVEVVHCYLERPDEPAVANYEAADREALERELLKPGARRGRGPLRALLRTAFRAMCGLPGPGRALRARIGLTLRLSVGTPS